jgi:hypothetical protein
MYIVVYLAVSLADSFVQAIHSGLITRSVNSFVDQQFPDPTEPKN